MDSWPFMQKIWIFFFSISKNNEKRMRERETWDTWSNQSEYSKWWKTIKIRKKKVLNRYEATDVSITIEKSMKFFEYFENLSILCRRWNFIDETFFLFKRFSVQLQRQFEIVSKNHPQMKSIPLLQYVAPHHHTDMCHGRSSSISFCKQPLNIHFLASSYFRVFVIVWFYSTEMNFDECHTAVDTWQDEIHIFHIHFQQSREMKINLKTGL